MDYTLLAERLFAHITDTPQSLFERYPARRLQEGAKVTRIAPSPTGFMHLGNLLGAVADERLAHQSGGVFYLRIEDTDQKREVPGAVQKILETFALYGLNFDEGSFLEGDIGDYGPYRQRPRAAIYQVFAKALVQKGLAYPCFCTEQQLEAQHEAQQAAKENFGYYGKWAVHRDMPQDQVMALLDADMPYVLRFKSLGDASRRFRHTDLVKGDMELPENDMDIVLLKSDGIPTYHFAHVIDDTLMGTTHVVRGDEWLATLPVHLQLFRALELKPPKYLHIAPLMKQEGESKRKLSKRKDPELALDFYAQEGYPAPAVIEYLLTLLNSNFEEWRLQNPQADYRDFPFSPKKMSQSGALFDILKLRDISKTVLARMDTDEVFTLLCGYAGQFDQPFFDLLTRDETYTKAILSIGRGGQKPRKDLAALREAKPYMDFFFDELFIPGSDYPQTLDKTDIQAILTGYLPLLDKAADQTVWFDTLKELARTLGFCDNTKEYKNNPDGYKGHIGDVSMVLRVALCSRQNAPDLYAIMQILPEETIITRLQKAAATLG